MHQQPRVAAFGALAASALLALSACSGGGSDDASSAAGKSAAGKETKKGTSSSGSPGSKSTSSPSAAAGRSTGGSDTAQAVTSKVEVSIKSCQLRDASKLFAVVQLDNANGAADYAYTVKVRFLNSAHPDQAVYTTLTHQPVQAGAMKSALASAAWKGDSAAMPKTCEVAKATKVKTAG
ncbi:hypothetical protein [Streptomyces rapamycinicus]|uniref:Lipoprotein n=2 Tax=Streptomyces rapamycinicus TaxID=1226757 RepID=A0A3L8RC85_STRRN|nr:hypothetical protein [Streptomyces rapamycinicus]MBB4789262.1 hypothetical protein [Streptomyces rapamycinicus]RLV77231.1 hypothetical protein D3C57_102640 [Streptomyces rapamycinicus NRRL 5491]UTO67284.1 hypothetical protein LJB45_36615 [Streptomyces rapamycinicus]UTP35242.1 hypothetical protein LIV37_41750 [Streptomyces rapamycinicus NRRL 5491]